MDFTKKKQNIGLKCPDNKMQFFINLNPTYGSRGRIDIISGTSFL